jgi:lipopolysaccharide/colanic/teichoic acid biosynthesis glycosyltransferase
LSLAIIVGIESPGAPICAQYRTGRDGKVFRIFKFRTMRVREDCVSVKQAIRGDARITRVGALLRRTSMDELPQLMNVVRGEMSLVGPRPHAVAHDEMFAALCPEYRERFKVRPGITGWAQVNGSREKHPQQMI